MTSSRMEKALAALDERTGLVALGKAFVGQQQHGAPSLGRSLGAAVVTLFLVECLTGIALALVYSPSTTAAWGSVAYLETQVPLGSLTRAIHHQTTSALFIVAGLHLVHMLATAAYRRPREAGWVVGVLGLLLLPAFAITGNLLPMDEDGYWGAKIELEVMAAAPLGGLVKKALIGGGEIGNTTLTRFYTLHTLVLPAAFIGLAALHVVFARRRRAAQGEVAHPAIPGQVVRDVAVSALVVAVVIALAVTLGARLDAPADPALDYLAHPEWYFMALNQLNTLGGTLLSLIAPLLGVGFLVALPWLDRKKEGRPGAVVLVGATVLGLAFVGLTAKGLLHTSDDPKVVALEAAIAKRAESSLAEFRRAGVDAQGRLPRLAGAQLYQDKGCASCHDDPKVAAPRLAGWGTVERTSAFLENPDSERFFAKTPFVELMGAYEGPADQRELLARWLLADSGLQPPLEPAVRESGRKLFLGEGCTDCHNDPATPLRAKAYDFRQTGPDLNGYGGREWTRAVIRDANHPALFGDAISDKDLEVLMPAYPDLSEDELSLLVEWLVAGAPGAR